MSSGSVDLGTSLVTADVVANIGAVQITNGVNNATLTQVGPKYGLDVNILNSLMLSIDALTDSIRLGDGVLLNTLTAVGPKNGIDVNVIAGSMTGTFQQTGLTQGLKQSVYTITDVAQLIPPTALANRNGLSIRNWGTNVCYVGNSSVTAADGYPKQPGEEIQADVRGDAPVGFWLVCETGKTTQVRVLEVA